MKFVVDRIEGKIAICQNIKTKDIIEINIDKLPQKIKEGQVIKLENGIYVIDENEEELRRKRIEGKMESLWI